MRRSIRKRLRTREPTHAPPDFDLDGPFPAGDPIVATSRSGKKTPFAAAMRLPMRLAFILSDPAPTVWRELLGEFRLPSPAATAAFKTSPRTPAGDAAAGPRAGRSAGRPDPDR